MICWSLVALRASVRISRPWLAYLPNGTHGPVVCALDHRLDDPWFKSFPPPHCVVLLEIWALDVIPSWRKSEANKPTLPRAPITLNFQMLKHTSLNRRINTSLYFKIHSRITCLENQGSRTQVLTEAVTFFFYIRILCPSNHIGKIGKVKDGWPLGLRHDTLNNRWPRKD